MKKFNEFDKVNEARHQIKLDVLPNFKGTLPFLVSDNGELYRTTEYSASGAFYLSYDSYMMLKEYADNSKSMCDNLDLQKQAVVNKLKNTIQKVVVAVRDNTK